MILRNFTDENGHLYCCRKKPGKIFTSTPAKVLSESHLYTRYDKHGGKDATVESWLSAIEGRAAPIIRKIVKAARAGEVPGLTQSEKMTWDEFLCCQLYRLPATRELLSDDEIISETLDGFEHDKRPLTNAERREYEDPALQRVLTDNAWIETIPMAPNYNGQVMNALCSKGIAVGVIEKPNKSFVIGDNPFIRIRAPQGCARLDNPEAELLFPISHDVIVTHGLSYGREKRVSITDIEHIRALNERIFRQSALIVARSQRLVESLSGKRIIRRTAHPARKCSRRSRSQKKRPANG